jgi:hypothetical protein
VIFLLGPSKSSCNSALSAALRKQLIEEIARSSARMRESIGPYSRFVRAEGDKLRETDARLRQLASDLRRVRERVDAIAASRSGPSS